MDHTRPAADVHTLQADARRCKHKYLSVKERVVREKQPPGNGPEPPLSPQLALSPVFSHLYIRFVLSINFVVVYVQYIRASHGRAVPENRKGVRDGDDD